MTKLQKIQLKLSESREAINTLQGKQDRSEEDNRKLQELRTAHQGLEAEYRTTLEQTPDPQPQVIDSEQRELDRLVGRAQIGNVLASALDQRATSGAEQELQAHFGLAGNQIPVELLFERRAATSAPSEVGQMQTPIIAPIFPDGVASFLGVGMPTVPVGDSTYTVLTTRAAVGTPAKGGAQTETDGNFTASVLTPKRAQASFFWRIEDEARLRGMESALRSNLEMSLRSKLDNLVLNDTAEGLLAGGVTAPSNPGAEAVFADYKKAVTGQVDGRFASMPEGVRLILGSETYQHAEGVYRSPSSAGGTDQSGYEVLVRKSGGVRVSSHVPAAVSNIQGAIAARRMDAMHAVLPIWRGITLIPDRITKAAAGEMVLTAVLLWSLKVVRTDGFGRLKFKLVP